MGAVSSSPRYRRIQEMPSPHTKWSASTIIEMPGVAATWPPITMTDFGDTRRTVRHISRTFPILTMMEEMPTMSYWLASNSASKVSRVGKSRTVVGAEMFCWIIKMPHER